MSFLVILNFRSTAKKELMDFFTWSNFSINWLIFRHLIKKFDQVKRSSEIWSTDPLSIDVVYVVQEERDDQLYQKYS